MREEQAAGNWPSSSCESSKSQLERSREVVEENRPGRLIS